MKNKIFLIGSGPIVIGQACEFDYSGFQACKSLNEENYKVILLNSNPASIMTDSGLCYKTYIEPMCIENIVKILKKEKPNYILPSFGGQTALNLVIKLEKKNILDNFNIKLLGTSIESIENSENRSIFRKIMIKNDLPIGISKIAKNIKDCLKVRKYITKVTNNNYVVVRPSYTLGGLGGGISSNKKDFISICKSGLKLSMNNEILVEESFLGWKEYEMEILIDKNDNFIVVCTIENIDPTGIHTGDSITISPTQTITDKELQKLRFFAKKIIVSLGIKKCGCNVQFSINSINGVIKIIEVNPRISRSSALASKITGYPIAKITTKLALGYLLTDIYNEITENIISAFFEPSIDYVAIKIPKFCNEKFMKNIKNFSLGTQMRSVGEIMSIGSTFEEAFSKSLRSLDDGNEYFINHIKEKKKNNKYIINNISKIYYSYDMIRLGFSIKSVYKRIGIEKWYLFKISKMIYKENEFFISILKNKKKILKHEILNLKLSGFPDYKISFFLNLKFYEVRKLLGIIPGYNNIDTCSNEFFSKSSYLYSTYFSKFNKKNKKNSILILGSGANKIGQGLEFDYCCTHASNEIRRIGMKSAIINCNPETISTDYNISNKLYFEPLNKEDLFNLIISKSFIGVILQFGGQTSLNFNNFLRGKVNILGTSVESIEITEDRKKFRNFLKKNLALQPKSFILNSKFEKIKKTRYPILVRPSFILGGRYIKKINNKKSLEKYIKKVPSNIFPILIDEFLEKAFEFDIDCVFNGKNLYFIDLMQHIEKAGIHSGDSTGFFPSLLSSKNKRNIFKLIKFICKNLKILGSVNFQIAIVNNRIYIIEINPRASRSIPVINKTFNINMISISIFSIIFGRKISFFLKKKKPVFFSIKEPVFSSIKYPDFDPKLGPEMKSTGEVFSFGKNLIEAFIKSQISVNEKVKSGNFILFSSGNVKNLFIAKLLNRKIYVEKILNFSNITIDFYYFLKKRKINLVLLSNPFYKNEKKISKNIRTIIKNLNISLFTTDEAILSIIYSVYKKFKFNPISINNVYKKSF
ncbi:carbamoyl-phosphate synthase large subunit [Candidatus Vidania fulgoroideorum]